MIKRIRIQNYRSLIDVDVELGPLTVLIGRSGTGKTNFVRAIRTLRDALLTRQSTQWTGCEPLSKSKSTISYEVEIELPGANNRYLYKISANYNLLTHQRPSSESLYLNGLPIFQMEAHKWVKAPDVVPIPKPDQFILSNLNGSREASVVFNLLTRGVGCYDFPGTVLQSNAEKLAIGYQDDGQNYVQAAGGILDDLTRYKDWVAMTRSLTTLNSSVKSIDLRLPDRKQLQLSYRAGDKAIVMDNSSESEGFRRYFATLLALFQTPSKPLCIFEHPETGIHPGALEMLAGEFQRHVERGRGQVLLTTHSPQLLDHFEADQLRVATIENQQTIIGLLESAQAEALRLNLMSPADLLTVDPARLEGQLAEVPA